MLIELADVRLRLLERARIGKRLLDEALAIVERSCDGHGRHVAAKRRELRLLDGRDAAVGKQDDDTRARETKEGLRDGAAGVAGRRHEHGQLRSPALKCAIRRAITRAPTSLNANVGP